MQKEFDYENKNLNDFKNMIYNKDFQNNENQEFFNIIKECCKFIYESFSKENSIKKLKVNKNKKIDVIQHRIINAIYIR